MFNGLLKTLDVGDIIGAVGAHVKRTEKGELSVVPSRVEVLTKSLLPLPEKFHGLTDLEKRFRRGRKRQVTLSCHRQRRRCGRVHPLCCFGELRRCSLHTGLLCAAVARRCL